RVVAPELDPRPLHVQIDVVDLDVDRARLVARRGDVAQQIAIGQIAGHQHDLTGLHVGSEGRGQLGQPAAALRERQICHSPPRNSGTRAPSASTPSTSTSGLPIMKSMWMELVLTASRSACSSTPPSSAFPTAMWLAAFSSSS